MKTIRTLLGGILLILLSANAGAQKTAFGEIDFPTSGSAAAQPHFLEGVKALHSFQWTEAGIAFRKAQEVDPDFALAYWGEAMSYNHPLWAQQDTEKAKSVLEKVAPTLEGRLASVPTEKEKAWLSTIETLYYTPGDKLTRDKAYADAMAAMAEKWSDDHEAQIFYALSLLGTVRPGDKGFRRQALAASIAQKVFDENPNHPGAAHFVIHSFDDPDHAILALPAAEVYADIAPMAAHALHMPSHIFVQLGKWQRVVDSNIDAYDAAMRVVKELNSPEGGEDFHTLSWLGYGYLMLGDTAMSEKQLDRAREAMARNPENRRVHDGFLRMHARHILESGLTPKLAIASVDEAEGSNDAWLSAVGMTAARNGDIATANAAVERLVAQREAANAKGDSYNARRLSILEHEISALTRMSEGDSADAVKHAKAAAELEMEIGAPSGPPDPIKPALELHGEILLADKQYDEAVAAFEQSLQWIPQRTPSMLGLARAAAGAGNDELARKQYQAIIDMPGINGKGGAAREAREYLGARDT